jgi:hypothetical protein
VVSRVAISLLAQPKLLVAVMPVLNVLRTPVLHLPATVSAVKAGFAVKAVATTASLPVAKCVRADLQFKALCCRG